MDWLAAISQVGFPAAIAVYMVIRDGKNTDKYITLALQASLDSKASTVAIEQSSKVIETNTAALVNNTAAFNRISGVLDAQAR